MVMVVLVAVLPFLQQATLWLTAHLAHGFHLHRHVGDAHIAPKKSRGVRRTPRDLRLIFDGDVGDKLKTVVGGAHGHPTCFIVVAEAAVHNVDTVLNFAAYDIGGHPLNA